MKRLAKKVCGIFVFTNLLLLLACNPDRQDHAMSISVIGDSISNGHRLADPWPPMLKIALGVPVYNHSISGEQTDYGLSIIRDVIKEDEPTHIVIMLGTNDAVRGTVSTALDNLQEMVNIALEYDVVPVVATLPPLFMSEENDQKCALISEGIAQLKGATIVDVRTPFNNERSWFADGVHPNIGGQKLIAETMADLFHSLPKADVPILD